jgi:hypothetical protein
MAPLHGVERGIGIRYVKKSGDPNTGLHGLSNKRRAATVSSPPAQSERPCQKSPRYLRAVSRNSSAGERVALPAKSHLVHQRRKFPATLVAVTVFPTFDLLPQQEASAFIFSFDAFRVPYSSRSRIGACTSGNVSCSNSRRFWRRCRGHELTAPGYGLALSRVVRVRRYTGFHTEPRESCHEIQKASFFLFNVAMHDPTSLSADFFLTS